MEKIRTYSNVNKKFNGKGVVDYRVILFIVIYACVIYQILDFFDVGIMYTIYFLLLSLIPLFGIYFTVSKEENITHILINIFIYLTKPKIYVYKYETKERDLKKYNFKYIKDGCKNK